MTLIVLRTLDITLFSRTVQSKLPRVAILRTRPQVNFFLWKMEKYVAFNGSEDSMQHQCNSSFESNKLRTEKKERNGK